MDTLVSTASTAAPRSFLMSKSITSIHDFVKHIARERYADPSLYKGKSDTEIGACCVQKYIIDTITNYSNKPGFKKVIGGNDILRERLAYFSSKDFIKRFLVKIPHRYTPNEKVAQTCYSNYFNTLFYVNFRDF